jgi:hypothetical protein
MAHRICLDPDTPQIHLDWDEAARTTVGILRMAAGRQPIEKTHGPKRFRHPTVGDVTLNMIVGRTVVAADQYEVETFA